MNSKMFLSTIVHQRFLPFSHVFKYVVPSLLLDLNELQLLKKRSILFSINSFNIFSFYEKDHGYRDKRSINEFIKNYLNKFNIGFSNLNISILCFPRIIGYVFNPLSTIYCYDGSKLIAIFYEVKNTSNEQHTYVFFGENSSNNIDLNHSCSKQFYVSPFIEMKGYYKFRNEMCKNSFKINIELINNENKKILSASQFGKFSKINSLKILRFILLNPLLSFKVIFAILFEAIRIIYKGGKYYSRNKKSEDTISLEGSF